MYTTLITAPELHALIEQDDTLVLDCRFSLADAGYGQRVYREAHLPGACFMHLDDDLSSPITPQTGRHPLPDVDKLADKLRSYGLNNNQQVVVYDDCGGAMAARSWWLLRWLGHDAVAVLNGGYPHWVQAGFEVTQTVPKTECGDFAVCLRDDMNLSVDEVLKSLDDQSITLVDARGAERYRGEQEPIDPVAGHIPGALNRPLTDNLENGLFKSAGQLQVEWQQLLGTTEAQNVVHYCGSGVTACHNQLAMAVAGITGTRIYAGSWSEWIREPARPVATIS
ncbi:sulfurtransferase [Pontibacterium granulatum]|uniref:sulfurtransferase n=1 Tax=Pontibacterium granulatum TaxID=2036029 RepID=UPI002499E52A|nr:sulfurtransferase [Pontibacterium granulatum]MDI3323575.1 sulfurtransferase [Pontibacterium granulatum]